MDAHARHGVKIDHCPACGGVWLDKGELDHLVAALRPPVILQDPAPPKPRPEGPRARGSPPQTVRKPVRPEAPEPEGARKPGTAHRYRRRHSNRIRLKDVLEEIFDFD